MKEEKRKEEKRMGKKHKREVRNVHSLIRILRVYIDDGFLDRYIPTTCSEIERMYMRE